MRMVTPLYKPLWENSFSVPNTAALSIVGGQQQRPGVEWGEAATRQAIQFYCVSNSCFSLWKQVELFPLGSQGCRAESANRCRESKVISELKGAACHGLLAWSHWETQSIVEFVFLCFAECPAASLQWGANLPTSCSRLSLLDVIEYWPEFWVEQ